MNILISNDDGIFAKGIKVLVEVLKKNGYNTYVVAPESEKSGTGHGVTLHRPLRVREVYENDVFFGYAIEGKPTDCIKLGYWELFKSIKFDFVISGINRGENLGTDIFYSGTVSAAAEGAMLGLNAIAISLAFPADEENYSRAAKFLVSYLESISEIDFPSETLLNINIPNTKSKSNFKYEYTYQGDRKYKDEFIERSDPRGNKYYWLGGEVCEYEKNKEADFMCVKRGNVSITPIKLNLTDREFFSKLKELNNK